MPERFKSHIERFIKIKDDEFPAILGFFQLCTARKKENLLVEGSICKHHYFVLNGCLRKFFINDKGVEQTIDFAVESWWITGYLAYEYQQPTEFYIQAVEASELLRIESGSQERLLATFPEMERYFRFIYQRAYGASQMRIKYLFGFSKEEIFQHFNQQFPEFVRRVPQNLLASFLGFTPEYMSAIKKKISS